ncbi:hypothetical protein BaRGS_00013166 [Batillaria attramentaria]|uniref:Uncharacterized protein n=1 Tax=Batillaria attramentaria TaxID=370345 RepID=A0ABD0L834_9CAEN
MANKFAHNHSCGLLIALMASPRYNKPRDVVCTNLSPLSPHCFWKTTKCQRPTETRDAEGPAQCSHTLIFLSSELPITQRALRCLLFFPQTACRLLVFIHFQRARGDGDIKVERQVPGNTELIVHQMLAISVSADVNNTEQGRKACLFIRSRLQSAPVPEVSASEAREIRRINRTVGFREYCGTGKWKDANVIPAQNAV